MVRKLETGNWKLEADNQEKTDPKNNRSLTDSQLGYPGLMPLRPKPTMSARADNLDTGAQVTRIALKVVADQARPHRRQ